MSTTFFTHLQCSNCSTTYSPHEIRTTCPSCGKALLAQYDLLQARRILSPRLLQQREGTLWRYRELLPLVDDANRMTLGEGWTPLLTPHRLRKTLGLHHLFIKEEGLNPTGSFKARGISLAISKAKELNITAAAMPSAGNAGGALAAYAAKAGIAAHVFVPTETPKVNVHEVSLYGGSVYRVEGTIRDAGKKMAEERRDHPDWFDMSTMKEPYRLEGKKTMGYEIAEQFGWQLPDVILYPTGGGTGLIGMWKAFKELVELGWIPGDHKPRMVSIQANGCAPIVKAFREQKQESEVWEKASTIASGLRVPKAFADHLILQALYESGGTAVSVTDDEIIQAMHMVARTEGIFLCPEGAATVASLRHLVDTGFLHPHESIVLFNTGTGYKYVELFAEAGAG